MAKTVAELAIRVLEKIGTLTAGDTPSPADSTKVTDFYANAYQEYERLEIAFWDEDSIPEYVYEALVDLLAGRLSADEGWPRPELEASGDNRLRLMAVGKPSGEILTTDYF